MAKAVRPGSSYDAQAGQTECAHVLPYPIVSPIFGPKSVRRDVDEGCDRQESYGTPDTDKRTGLPLDVGATWETSGAAKKNGGMFEKGLLTALESAHRNGGAIPEVKVVANGHCHGGFARNLIDCPD